MTVGIVARNILDGSFVAVSDEMMSWSDQYPAEDGAMLKNHNLWGHWYILSAGNDITAIPAIISRATSISQKLDERDSLDSVKLAVSDAYRNYLDTKATMRFLSRLGYRNVTEFRQQGIHELGGIKFDEIVRNIETFDIETQFLVYGFDDKYKYSQIFSVNNPGDVTDHGMTGYWAIGTGAPMALSMLRTSKVMLSDVAALIYHLCNAKFNAETAYGVGKNTSVFILGKGRNSHRLSPHVIDSLRNRWKAAQDAEVPSDIITEIARGLSPVTLTGLNGPSTESATHQERQA